MQTYPDDYTVRLAAMAAQFIRPHNGAYLEDGQPVVVFDPPLTTDEQARFDRLRTLVRSAVQVTPDEWQALEPTIGSLRTNRTRTNAEWSAMTAAQRDTALIDWCRNLTDVLRALLRD